MDKVGQSRWLIGLVLAAALTALVSLVEPGWSTTVETFVALTVGLDLVLSANSASRGVCSRDRYFYLRRALVALVGISIMHVSRSFFDSDGAAAMSALLDLNLILVATFAAFGNLLSARIIAGLYPYQPSAGANEADAGPAAGLSPSTPPPN
jgi:hypothetical protein